ncbi:fucose-binding lectin II [Streptomyces sp. NPDC127051]|uniref:fucose-binding lectin II n=1 Tax=Streptomyces sp. NPDC127051 TaxID=3347119 RepID=UPI003669647D
MSGSVEVKVSAGASPVSIRATISSPHVQRVTIKPDGPAARVHQWTGVGEGAVELGSVQENRSADRVFTVTVESSDDEGQTFKPSAVRVSEVLTASRPAFHVVTVQAENDGDSDFDDALVHFSFIG